MTYIHWTDKDDEYLMKYRGTMKIKDIAKILGRTESSCYTRIKRLKKRNADTEEKDTVKSNPTFIDWLKWVNGL